MQRTPADQDLLASVRHVAVSSNLMTATGTDCYSWNRTSVLRKPLHMHHPIAA